MTRLRGALAAAGIGSRCSTTSSAERERIALYRAYLHLIMWIEAVPRRYDGKRLDWLRGFACRPLTETLDRWASPPS